MRALLSPALLFAACAAPLECPPGSAPNEDETACEFDEDGVRALVGDLEGGPLEKLNAEPFDQLFGTMIRRNIWMTRLALPDLEADTVSLYLRLDPEDYAASLPYPFPVGTVIVHEAVDREEGHGVMVKREAGYQGPGGEAWWSAKIFDDGTDDTNVCTPCESCHAGMRAGTEGLYGLPLSAR